MKDITLRGIGERKEEIACKKCCESINTTYISTTRYLELFDISNFFPGPLDILQSLRLKCMKFSCEFYFGAFFFRAAPFFFIFAQD